MSTKTPVVSTKPDFFATKSMLWAIRHRVATEVATGDATPESRRRLKLVDASIGYMHYRQDIGALEEVPEWLSLEMQALIKSFY